MDNRPIGIFDSGVGGLTVFKAIYRAVPKENIIYFGDTARFPYGPRELSEVKNLSLKITEFLLKNGVKIIVVACNTSTAAALEFLKKSFDIPIIGVIEPGARTAVKNSSKKRIGVIATKGTVESRAYENAVKKINPDFEIFQVAAPKLVEYVETDELHSERLREDICNYLEPLNSQDIDVLILGCTHFPIIEKEIRSCCRQNTEVINSAIETAKDVKEILLAKEINASPENRADWTFYQTGNSDKFLKIGKIFMGKEIKEVKKVNLEI